VKSRKDKPATKIKMKTPPGGMGKWERGSRFPEKKKKKKTKETPERWGLTEEYREGKRVGGTINGCQKRIKKYLFVEGDNESSFSNLKQSTKKKRGSKAKGRGSAGANYNLKAEESIVR